MTRWITALLYALLVVLVSAMPQQEFPTPVPKHFDKIAHAIEFAILAFLVCRAADKQARSALIVITLICIVYGIGNEALQRFVPGRYPAVGDAVADAIGSAAGTILWLSMRRRRTVSSQT